ncbi:transposase [Agrobacterium sp. SHOUNA12C]|uniref:transposase n=1 Tax=Rhizobium rhizogenes TaxID=359 RepID=UPI001573E233|nr:transposase [Rhizobium rhizogenes]MCJ9724751.1 transposase [Agrobacterium sp. BETTINA12B]MCJ9760393.1 transposase [Agrobacterium sp. SHOUNA12C]NTF53047.1 transposase [Rhizobium rhizogenes]NTG18430.1 transposase [Rhizobium rhizogenes]NTG25497.1 transposase [Rhizobium rhizogenes]
MTDESNTEAIAAVMGQDAKASTTNTQRSPRRQKAAAESVRPVAKATPAKVPTSKSSRSSEQERAEKFKLIETQVAEGTSSLKDAIKSASISEQTYYNWKRALRPVDQRQEKPAPAGDEFADLVQLEQENQRLRKILAEKLRAENAELRKRLGLG